MQRHFFATAEDLLEVFDRVEAKMSLTYTLAGLFPSPALNTVHNGATIPTLRAQAPAPGSIAGYTYLVTHAGEDVVVRKVGQTAGGVLYAVDQFVNPRSLTITPGGFYPPNVHLSGRIATASDDDLSTQLYRAFASAVGKLFHRVQSFYVGHQAEESWRRGMRLAIDATSPPLYDLVLPGPGPTS